MTDQGLFRQLRKVAREIVGLDQRLRAVERTAQGKWSSVSGGGTNYYDNDGNIRQTVGAQPDGSYTVQDYNGPALTPPSAPVVTARPGTLTVAWDGLDANASSLWPSDFSHVEIHVSTTPGYTPVDATQVGSFHSRLGGSITLALDPIEYYVKFVTVNTSRVESAPSTEVDGTPLPVETINGIAVYREDEPPAGLGLEDEGSLWFDTNDKNHLWMWDGTAWISVRDEVIGDVQDAVEDAVVLANSKNKVFYNNPTLGDPIPTATSTNDIWIRPDAGNRIFMWDGTSWVSTRDTGIQEALDLADSVNDAVEALEVTANGKNQTFYQASAPSANAVGDIWYDTDDGYKMYRASATGTGSWVSVQDSAINAAIAAAADAQSDIDATNTVIFNPTTGLNATYTLANGKNRVYYQTTQPTGGTYTVGDTWFDTDDSNRIYRYNGSTWTSTQFGTAAIADSAIDATKIQDASITNAEIVDGTIQNAKIANLDGGKITVNTLDGVSLKANTVTAKNLILSDTTNLISLGDAQNATIRAAYPLTTPFSYVANAGPNGTGDWVLRLSATTTDSATAYIGEKIAVEPGQQFRVAWKQKRNSANQVATLNFHGWSKDNTVPSGGLDIRGWVKAPTAVVTNSTWDTYGGILTIPANVFSIQPNVKLATTADMTGTWDFTDFRMYRAANADLIVDGSVSAAKMVTGTITAGSGIIASLDAGVISAGTLDADRIGANSIVVEKLVVTDTENLAQNGNFIFGEKNWLDVNNQGTVVSSTSAPAYLEITGNGTTNGAHLNNQRFDVKLADEFWVSYEIWADPAISLFVEPAVGIWWNRPDGTFSVTSISAVSIGASAGQWIRYEGALANIDANATNGVVTVGLAAVAASGNKYRFRNISVRRRKTGDLIVDGSITGDKIVANSITADQIAAGVLNAGGILTGALEVGDAITLSPLTGITVVGPPTVGDTVFPTDGSNARIAGELVASSLEIRDNLSINGSGSMNGELKLKSGISKPLEKPILSYEWPKLREVSSLGGGTTDNSGIYNDMTNDLNDVTGNISVVGFQFLTDGGLRFFDHRTGDIAAYPDPTQSKTWKDKFGIYSVAADPVRGLYWVMGVDSNRSSNWYIYAIDKDTFDKRGEWYFWTYAAMGGGTPFVPRMDYYNGTLYVAFSATNGIHVRRMTPGGSNAVPTLSNVTGASPADFIVISTTTRYAIGAFAVGTFDAVAAHIVLRLRTTGNFYVFKASDGTVATELGPFLSPASTIEGLKWTSGGTLGSRFIAYDNYGQIYQFSENKTNSTVTASYSYYDPDSTAPSGTHETEDGPVLTYTWQCRSWLAAQTRQAPDEQNFDPSNTDKANATRLYIALGAGSRQLQETLGQSQRTQSVYLNSAFPDTLSAAWTTGVYTFTTEDIGASVTGTYIPVGTIITGVSSDGSTATISQNHTRPAGSSTFTMTITRSVFSHRMKPKSALITGTKTPEVTNGFLSANVTPGVLRSTAQDVGGAIIKMLGDGSWRMGQLSGDADGTFHNSSPVLEFNPPSQSQAGTAGWGRMTGGGITVTVSGLYMIQATLIFNTGSAGTVAVRAVGVATVDGASAPDADMQDARYFGSNIGATMTFTGFKYLTAGAVVTPWRYTSVVNHYAAGAGYLRAIRLT